MDFKNAVEIYKNDPTADTLRRVAGELRSELKTPEKLWMLSGHGFFARNGFDLITKGRKYNYRPCVSGGVKRLGIPPVAFSDGPRGCVMGDSTCFPVSMARGASFDEDLEYEIGSAIADEVTAQGGNYFAGICINLLRNPRWGRAQETYGEDPFLLSKMGAAITRAVQDKGVIACPKHYAVNSIENIRFSADVRADDKTLREVYLPHFKACVDAGAMSVMGAYNKFRGEHCCESRYLLTDILRGEWGFEGFVISDFLFGVKNGAKALKAGLDIEMPQTLAFASLPLDLRRGKITMDDVDTACERILKGLIKTAPRFRRAPESVVASRGHTALAKRAALEGTVLLKNDGTLPLKPPAKVAVIGRYANKINVGDHGSSSVSSPYVVTPYQGLCDVFGWENVVLCEGTDFSGMTEQIRACDCAVLCVGSDYRQEGENLANFSSSDSATKKLMGGDRYSLRIPENEVELIHRAAAAFDKVVVNIIGGSAYIIEEWKDEANAVFHSFYGGMEGGGALAELIAGIANPCGHLPFTMAKSEDDYPPFLFPGDKTQIIEYGPYHGYTLLDKEGKKAAFPFGFGLSYTVFEYSGVKAAQKDDKVLITLKVRNTGDRDGKTVVQVYASAPGDHPVKLLKGFKKVPVAAGRQEKVTVEVDKDDLKFYDPDSKSRYLEKEYSFFVGQDSDDAMNNKITITL